MPKHNPWRLKEPVLDAHVQASIDGADGKFDETTGHYATLHYTGCETRERAKEIVQALFRAAKRKKVSMSATVHPADDKTFYVEYKAINKAHARAYIVQKYGSDRSKWPYSPFKTDPNYSED